MAFGMKRANLVQLVRELNKETGRTWSRRTR